MAEIYRDIGSLKELKSELQKNEINDFHSVKEIHLFLSEYENEIKKLEIELKEQLKNEIEQKNNQFLIENENYYQKINERVLFLKSDKLLLEAEYKKLCEQPFGFFSLIKNYYRKKKLKKRLNGLENNFQNELENPFLNIKKK